MYVDLRTYFWALYTSLFKQRFSLRRWFWVILFTGLYWLFWCGNAFARLLDYVFFPGFVWQKISDPIFIVATPRSGTTFTQRLMCLDENRFTYFKLYQTILPAVSWYKLIAGIAWIDRRTGKLLARLLRRLERRFFGGWDGVHNMGFARAEEDEGLFVFPLLSPGIFLLFTEVGALGDAGMADNMSPKRRQKLMRYYRSCLKRHLYATGRDKILLSKNTLFSGRIEAVREAFPDARIIYLVRNPREVVPSFLSMWYKAWHAHSPDIDKISPQTRAFAELTAEYYRHMLAAKERFAPDRFVVFRYSDLVSRPREAIESIYERLGLEMNDEFRARLADATKEAREYKSKHSYSLEEYGLGEDWIQDRLGEVLAHYGFDEPERGEGEGADPSDRPAAAP